MTTEKLIDEQEAADMLGISRRDLRDKRARGVAPPHYRLGTRTVRYRPSEVQAWLDGQRVDVGGE